MTISVHLRSSKAVWPATLNSLSEPPSDFQKPQIPSSDSATILIDRQAEGGPVSGICSESDALRLLDKLLGSGDAVYSLPCENGADITAFVNAKARGVDLGCLYNDRPTVSTI